MLRDVLRKTPWLKKTIRLLVWPLLQARLEHESSAYQAWVSNYSISSDAIVGQQGAARRLTYRPLISVVVPTYNTPKKFFAEMIESVFGQTYENWELVLVDDASPDANVRKMIEESAKHEKRIRYKILPKNLRIAAATNEGIKIASGEFVSLFDHDDVLQPDALFEIVKALNENKSLDFIYTDEDKISEDKNHRHQPFFKPDWNSDFLRSINYITHFTTIRKSVLDKYGYEDGAYNGTQDWELFLRITRNIPAQKIHHIPKILYGWRVHEASTAKDLGAKPYVTEAQQKALDDDMRARGQKNFVLQQDILYPAQWQLAFQSQTQPKVSIVTHDPAFVAGLRADTAYPDWETVVLDPGASYQDVLKQTTGDYLVFVNGMTKVRQSSWINDLLGDAARDGIGFVLAECKESDVIKNLKGILDEEVVDFIARSTRRLAARHFYTTTRYNIRAVHGGVVMVSKKKLRVAVADPAAAFHLQKISEQLVGSGLYNLYNPYIKVLQ